MTTKQASDRDPEEMSSDFVVGPDALVRELHQVAKVGTSPRQFAEVDVLSRLSLVRVAAAGTSATDVALAIAQVVRRVADDLGEGPYAQATRLFFGVDQDSRGLRLEDRRGLAADRIGVSPETWRKNWERHTVEHLALELYRQETEAKVVVHVRTGKRSSDTVLADLAQGTGGKDLLRREDEARLMATAYSLRAELFAGRRMAEEHDDTALLDHAMTALREFTRFSDEFANFVTNYGTGIVMAGNEVTAREAASLLGFRPGIEDQDISFLRMVAGGTVGGDNDQFVSVLTKRDPERMNRIVQRWMESIVGNRP